MLVLLALPVVAEPPVVLLLTLAEPVEALWLLVVLTFKLVVFITCVDVLSLTVTLLVELGPVLLMLAVLLPPVGVVTEAVAPVLSTLAETAVEVLFMAEPEPAPPPVVLLLTLAEPVEALCEFDVVTPALVLFLTL